MSILSFSMNTANLGVDRSLETTIARNQSAILWKIQDAILHLVKLRTPIKEKTSYDRGDINAPHNRHHTHAGKAASEIWTEVRQGNFWTSLRQDFDNSIDREEQIEILSSRWGEYMKRISDSTIIQCLAEEIVFTQGTLLDSEIDLQNTLKKIQKVRETYTVTLQAVESYEDQIRNRVGEIIKIPIFPTLEDRHVELLLDVFPRNTISSGGVGSVRIRALIAHLDTESLDQIEKRANDRNIKDRGLFNAIQTRREVIAQETVEL